MSDYNFAETVSGRLCAQLKESLADAIIVPNSWLPTSYHTKKREQTLRDVERKYNKTTGKRLTKEKAKAEKAARVARYVASMEQSGTINYEVDEHALYQKQINFCSGLVRCGVLTAEDFDEE